MIGFLKHATLWKRFRRDSTGAALVEFAIIAPLLFLLIFGIIDFGRVFFLINNLTNAAREGARLGAVLHEGQTGVLSQIQTATRSRINDNYRDSATYNVSYQGAAPQRTVRVEVANYKFTPVTFLALRSIRQLSVRAEFRLEFQ